MNDQSEYIELNKLLKFENLVQTGGHARLVIEDGLVRVNGEVEYRIRRKLRSGDRVEIDGKTVVIASEP
ncbi:MAG: RNA-binding S4 domain-containing protein [Lewinellaceae bacterium]|nr:RNA-binding S4 domain-containing protein [Lewinellaceae bacterium]HRW76063.1 RNA-binding S4 domain-containing protein [Saprospiraceae bacterium]